MPSIQLDDDDYATMMMMMMNRPEDAIVHSLIERFKLTLSNLVSVEDDG
jgi:hypothetical protein